MAETDNKPVFVLVHGSWHSPAHFDRVIRLLQRAEYTVHAPKLPSVRSHGQDTGNALEEDTTAIANAIRSVMDTGRDVILVMHSYGGAPGTDAAAMICEEQKSNLRSHDHGRIRELIYIAGFVLDKGMNLVSVQLPGPSQGPPPPVSEEGLRSWGDASARFYNTTPLETAEEAILLLRPSARSVATNRTRYSGWRDYGLPVEYIACTQDRGLPAEVQ